MLIKEGQLVHVVSSRKGKFDAVATKDFDTLREEWFPLKVASGFEVYGMSQIWVEGDEIPSRNTQTKIII